jgi:OOP family OmpA-OmpF porin
MKKSVKLGALAATASLLAACASSGGGQGPSITVDPKNSGYVQSNDTGVVMSGFGNCVRQGFFTPAHALKGCDDDLLPKAPPPPPPPPPRATSEKVTFAADAFFDFDKAVLKPDGKAKLDDLTSKLSGIALEVIIAVGHTDSVGADAYNQRLSVRRSEAVKAYLVSKGIEANRVYTEGKGEKQPVADNKTRDGRAKNRRVEIEVVGTRPVR